MEQGKWGIKFGIYSFILSMERIGLFPSFTHCGFCVLFSWFFYLKETSIFLFIIVPIIKFFYPKIKKVYDNFMGLVNDTSTLFGILVIIVIFLIPFIILYISYIFTLSRYNSLIHDLNQIIVFNNYYKDKCENL